MAKKLALPDAAKLPDGDSNPTALLEGKVMQLEQTVAELERQGAELEARVASLTNRLAAAEQRLAPTAVVAQHTLTGSR